MPERQPHPGLDQYPRRHRLLPHHRPLRPRPPPPHPARPPPPPTRPHRRPPRHRPARPHQQQRQLPHHPAQLMPHQQTRRISPMQIVNHQHHRPANTQPIHQPDQPLHHRRHRISRHPTRAPRPLQQSKNLPPPRITRPSHHPQTLQHHPPRQPPTQLLRRTPAHLTTQPLSPPP